MALKQYIINYLNVVYCGEPAICPAKISTQTTVRYYIYIYITVHIIAYTSIVLNSILKGVYHFACVRVQENVRTHQPNKLKEVVCII